MITSHQHMKQEEWTLNQQPFPVPWPYCTLGGHPKSAYYSIFVEEKIFNYWILDTGICFVVTLGNRSNVYKILCKHLATPKLKLTSKNGNVLGKRFNQEISQTFRTYANVKNRKIVRKAHFHHKMIYNFKLCKRFLLQIKKHNSC